MSVTQELKGKRIRVPFVNGKQVVRVQEFEVIKHNSKTAVLRKLGPETRGCEYDTWPLELVRDWVSKYEISDAVE